jgi:hypothetical protein
MLPRLMLRAIALALRRLMLRAIALALRPSWNSNCHETPREV